MSNILGIIDYADRPYGSPPVFARDFLLIVECYEQNIKMVVSE